MTWAPKSIAASWGYPLGDVDESVVAYRPLTEATAQCFDIYMPLVITAYQPKPCTVHFVGTQSLCEVLEYAKPTAYFHTSPSEWDKLRQEAEETVANAKPPSLDLGSN